MRPLDLYPVYSDYSSNIKTVFEGHEYDVAGTPVADDKPFMREGVGETSIATREVDGVKRYELSVKKGRRCRRVAGRLPLPRLVLQPRRRHRGAPVR